MEKFEDCDTTNPVDVYSTVDSSPVDLVVVDVVMFQVRVVDFVKLF